MVCDASRPVPVVQGVCDPRATFDAGRSAVGIRALRIHARIQEGRA